MFKLISSIFILVLLIETTASVHLRASKYTLSDFEDSDEHPKGVHRL